MRKINLKKDILKKISFLIAGVLILSLFLIPKFSIKADDNISTDVVSIKILEIEPGDLFYLTFSGGTSINPNVHSDYDYSKKTPQIPILEESMVEVNGSKINVFINHITMPEFISKIDEIDGEYDVIVIGRDNIDTRNNYRFDNTNGKGTNLGLVNTRKSNGQYNLSYIDYTNPFSEEIVDTNYNKVFKNSEFQSKEKEYFSENDITEKRVTQIKKAINNNVLVYMDDKIGKNDYREYIGWSIIDKTIQNTNLYNLYHDSGINTKDNLKKISFDKLVYSTLEEDKNKKISSEDFIKENIIKDYLNTSYEYRRPSVKNTIDKNNSSMPYAMLDGENIKFRFSTLNNSLEKLTIKIYIDLDGNGIFNETNECKVTDNFSCYEGKNEYVKDYNIKNYDINDIPWKIEITKESGSKTIILGTLKNTIKQEFQTINVLELTFDSTIKNNNGEPNNTTGYPGNPSKHLSKEYINKLNKMANNVGYNINFVTLSAEYVNSHPDVINVPYKYYNENINLSNFNESGKIFDAIVMERFWNSNYEFNESALKELDTFVESGKQMIFTGGTISDNISTQTGKLNNLTQKFRDYVGMARYEDPYNNLNINSNDIFSNINHDQIADNIYSAGISFPHVAQNFMSSNNVKLINSIRVTRYPYNLENGELNVSASTQVFQLNLNDSEVIPIYNLDIKYTDNGDSRNFYYAYSRGNITYWARMVDKDGYNDSETKFFINILVNKTQKNNNQPNIFSNQLVDKSLSTIDYENGKYNIDNYKNNITEMNENSVIELNSIEKGFNFITTVSDPDDDKVKITNIKINDVDINSNMIDNGKELMDDYKESGSQIGISISKNYLENIKNTESKEMTIEVYVEDENGGESTATYIIKLKNIMTIDHGLYKGLNSNPVIENLGEDNIKTFSAGTLVTVGVLLDGINKSKSIEIKFDDKLTDNNITQIQAYYVNSNNTLELISNNSKVTNNKYILSSLDAAGRKILIMYNEQLPTSINKDNDKYINKILVDNEDVNKPAIIRINGKLPDLF